MTISATKTIQIARSAAESRDFIADASTMPQWAIHNVKAIRDLGNGRWEMDTVRGKGTLIPQYDRETRILDHEFIDANEGRWKVTGRVVPVGPRESVYRMTLPTPDGLPIEIFEAGMKLMDEELAALKACIESRPEAAGPVRVMEGIDEGFRQKDMAKIFGLLAADVETALCRTAACTSNSTIRKILVRSACSTSIRRQVMKPASRSIRFCICCTETVRLKLPGRGPGARMSFSII
jgi:hypothetical protein